jgi:cytokinin riboside 5'-monophosphate phosphoribohydrolase
VFGAIPRSLVERELAYGPADELVVTETLRERKAEMDARADAFVALPGGFGTLEELLEVLTLRQLRLHDRPIVLVNANNFWDPFLAMVREIISQGFAPQGEGFLFEVAKTSEDAVALVEADHRGPAIPRRAAPPTDALAEDWTAEPA